MSDNNKNKNWPTDRLTLEELVSDHTLEPTTHSFYRGKLEGGEIGYQYGLAEGNALLEHKLKTMWEDSLKLKDESEAIRIERDELKAANTTLREALEKICKHKDYIFSEMEMRIDYECVAYQALASTSITTAAIAEDRGDAK